VLYWTLLPFASAGREDDGISRWSVEQRSRPVAGRRNVPELPWKFWAYGKVLLLMRWPKAMRFALRGHRLIDLKMGNSSQSDPASHFTSA